MPTYPTKGTVYLDKITELRENNTTSYYINQYILFHYEKDDESNDKPLTIIDTIFINN